MYLYFIEDKAVKEEQLKMANYSTLGCRTSCFVRGEYVRIDTVKRPQEIFGLIM